MSPAQAIACLEERVTKLESRKAKNAAEIATLKSELPVTFALDSHSGTATATNLNNEASSQSPFPY